MTMVLSAEHLTRVLPGEVPVTLVEDVNLGIAAGEFVTILGPSGSGKSSLLYLMGLLDMPSAGRILLQGEDTSRLDDEDLADVRLRKLGFVFQFHFLLAEFNCLDNIALPMRKLGALPEEAILARAEALLAQLGIAEQARKMPSQLSGGQRQRVAIARALANDPIIVFADEPTGNLDSASSANVRDIMRELADRHGKTIVAVSHDRSFAAAADRRVTLIDGRIDPAA